MNSANGPRILLTRRWPQSVETYLSQRYCVTFNDTDRPMSADELREAMGEFEIVCPTVSDRVDASVLQGPNRKVKLICNFGVGFDHIDIESCHRLGIAVTNTPDALTTATAELAILLMLAVARRAGEGERQVRSQAWTGWRPTHMLGASMTGKTLGLVGFGRIAREAARRARSGFGMKILYHAHRRAALEDEREVDASYRAELRDLLVASDFVSLHCPGGAATENLIDATRLSQMKASAFLINTARGSVVDESALIAALKDGTIAGAGIDVYRHEPAVREELLQLENVVLLPHLGSATVETRTAMGMRAVANIERWLDGEEPLDRVC